MATAAPSLVCDPCKKSGEEQVPVAFCWECRELYCYNCLNYHRKMKLTKLHVYVYLSGDELGEACPCDLCNTNKDVATSLCVECRELYCTACTTRHRKFKVSKNHVVVEIIGDKSDFNVTYPGAQVPINKKGNQNQQDNGSVNKKETATFVSGDKKNTPVSELLHSDNTAKLPDVKQTSLSGTFHCKFSVRTPSDEVSPDINRIISMPDGRICVVDRWNDKIKLYTDDYMLCDEVRVLGCTAVTCVDDDTVAIATGWGDITRYSVKGNKITQTGGTIHIDGDIYGIAYRRGEFITRYDGDNTDYTCCGSKVIVKQDRGLFLGDCIHFDPVSDCVILGNSWSSEEHTVTCYTLDGDVKWRVALDGGPRGIVMVHSVVLVADYWNDTIRQITMDGRLLSTPLLTKGHRITFHHAITYQHKQHRLLVTERLDENVMVFNLTK